MKEILKKHFGYDEFKPLQQEIIENVLSGKDSVVLMPTGGGKSLCFQLPALVLPGITIVISPLISLMKDQVDALLANGITADVINSTLTASEIGAVINKARTGALKILYIAPERLSAFGFEQFLQELNISLIAIDEAHCISEWGHDFRPEYRNLKTLRNTFPGVPIIALTATATEKVRDDIANMLNLDKPQIFISSFNRANLSYEVLPKKDSLKTILALLRNYENESVIIYCFSRNDTEKLVGNLHDRGFKAVAYHAGLDADTRKENQEKFIRDEINIVVATIAFGMGINKPDVRLVIHHSLPKSIEGYYQETGRAGRDGLPARCVLLFSYADKFKHDFFVRNVADPNEQKKMQQKLQHVLDYGNLYGCRRKFLLGYFDEQYKEANCGACDGCIEFAPLELEKVRVKVSKASTTTTQEEVPYNEELFAELKNVRTLEAQKLKVPPYIIFGDKSLREMATYYPQTENEFLNINGVGNQKLVQFGELFMAVIRAYVSTHKIEIQKNSVPQEQPVRPAYVGSTLNETKKFIIEKIPISSIASIRGLATTTVIDHVEKIVAADPTIDISYLKPEQNRFETIKAAFEKTNGFLLTPVRELLGEEYSYDELRCVRLFLKKI